nr:gastrotropin=14 kDa bile acid binding protein [rats, ileal cytosol, Peptide Partial, 14 aa] [Rattus sp.]
LVEISTIGDVTYER